MDVKEIGCEDGRWMNRVHRYTGVCTNAGRT